MIKNYKSPSKIKSTPQPTCIDPINESLYINTIITNNILEKFEIPSFKYIKISSHSNIMNIIRKTNYISSSKSNFKKLGKDSYLYLFLHLAVNILEYKTNINEIKEHLFKNYLLLLKKIYLNKKISIRDISILIKFLTFSSVYQRKEINNDNIHLLKNLTRNKIKSYETIKLTIDIIKIVNMPIVTIEYCEFLNAHFLMETHNLYLLTENIDLLELLFLSDQNDYILDFLSKIYSFRSNKSFLDLFIEKIKNIYKERRDKNINKENENEMNNSFMNLLYNLNRSILFIQSIKQNEDNKHKEDPYFPEKGFICNNNKTNGLYIEKIIVNNSLTLVFSFCFSPSPSQLNNNENDIEYPIIFASTDKDNKDCIYFYIKNEFLFYKQIKANKNINICNIKKNQTYLCYYSIKEHDKLTFTIKSDNFEFEVTDAYKDFLKKNLTMRIGRYDKQNFEGYIGPILIFKEKFENEYKNFIFSLKGHYDKILYFYDYNTTEVDKYDQYVNYILNDGNCTNYLEIKDENKKILDKKVKKDKKNKNTNNEIKINNRDYFLNLKNKLKENNILNKNLICYISPIFSKSALNKSFFINNIFVETLIKKFISESKSECSSTIFYKNKPFIFQFLKYDGFNYIIMVLELIMVNSDNIKTKLQQKTIIDIFQCILIFITGLLSYIDIESYYNDIGKFLFCIKKFIVKFSKMNILGEQIHLILNNTLQNLDSLNKNNFTDNKKYYINAIKNEICKILLDAELYDLNNFDLINKFMKNLSIFIENLNNSSDLLNIKLFKKIIDFANIYDKINIKNNKIKHDSQFKLFKNYFSKIIINFVSKSESLEIYKELYNIFSNDLKFNYLKYQSIRLFYLVADNYFNIVDENVFIKSWKYFIDLFEYFELKANNSIHYSSENDINEKEEYIIMSICLRIIIETNKYKDFLKLKLKESSDEIDPLENLLLKTKEEDIKNNINSSLIYKLISSGYWAENKKKYKNPINKKNKKENTKSKSFTKKIDFENNNNKLKRIYSKCGDKFEEKENIKSTKILFNYAEAQNFSSIIDNEKNKKIKKNKYQEYISYQNIFTQFSKAGKLNEYCFKAIVLFILENNNKIDIPRNKKLNFILKVKKYEQLQLPEYKSILCIKYYNKEIKAEFRILLKILNLHKNQLPNICYEILLFLLVQVIKNREISRGVCTNFIESKKICNKLFKYAFLYNKKSAELIIKEFPLFVKLVLPYHRKNFIAYLLYESIVDTYIHNNYCEQLFNIFLNTKSDLDHNSKYYYDFLINKILVLYHIFKTDKIYLDEKIDLEEKGILYLADENLMFTKYDLLYANIKKCYTELLFDFCINLYIKSKDKKYISIMNKIFIERIDKNNKGNKGVKTIIFSIDKNTIKDDKNNPCLKYYNNKNNKIDSCLCINLLVRTLKFWWQYRNDNDIKAFLQNLIINLFEDSKLIFKENKIFQKKDKDKKNVWYNLLIDILNEIINNKKEIKIQEIQQKIIEKNSSDIKTKENKSINNNNNLNTISNISISNISSLSMRDSLSLSKTNNSLESNKTNNTLSENEGNNNENEVPFDLGNSSINKSKEDKNKNQNSFKNNININNNTIINPNDILRKIRKSIINNKKLYSIIKDNTKNKNYKYIDDYLDIENINNRSKFIIFPKSALLEQRFSIYFTDILFYNKIFVLMKNYYKYYIKIKSDYKYDIDINNYFNYPTIVRNYTPKNIFFGEFFLKNDLNFFDNKLIKISHLYFMDKLEHFHIKNITIFPKKKEENYTYQLLVEKQKIDSNIFYVDLVTNRNVIFGQLIVNKNIIYFENLNKEEFLKNKTDSAKEKWLLCSLDCDYSKRDKKLYIFKNEIREIINRRFLYLFQACEIFLNNGKSYYFNFYSEEKKIQFFTIFRNENKLYNIDIIYDIKSSFKKKNYTKQWLTDELSTIEYLLFLNKYSSRSYNDINQYPIFPWLEIYGGRTRDLKYTIAAQTEEERCIKKEMYLASSSKFPYHYTTHYSNSAYLDYYLIRTNPFTFNQINLQNNKFDSPLRQFNAIDEILRILKHTSQPREVIPEFYLSTEFYYNYNCNFYGITDEGRLVNNLTNKEGFKSPLEYILHNLILIETPQVKNEINYFFDNIYGVGQMGGVDAYNTYDKYSYQEMLDLRAKIAKYRQEKLNYKRIKEKIMSKCNKIISFGQTPFKILEDKHPQWVPKKEKENNENISITNAEISSFNINRASINSSNADDENKNLFGIKISANILFFDIYTNIHKDNIKQYIFILNKYTKYKYELKFYDMKFKAISSNKNVTISKEIKLFSKLKIFNSNFLYAYKYTPKSIMIHFRLSLFVLCHFYDNSLKIFNSKGEYFSLLTESMVTCITKIKENSFITGHLNGKIIVWEIPNINSEKELTLNDFKKINVRTNFIAHKNRVNNIIYEHKLGVIISSGDDKKIFIRKIYDLTLLTIIDISNQICIDIKVEHYYLYVLLFDEIKQKHIIRIYSLNGIEVGKSEYDYINNFDFDKEGNILIGYYKKNYIDIYDPSLINKIGDIYFIISEQSKILNNDKKLLNENVSIGKDTLFMTFCYNKYNNSIYGSLSNGFLFCKNLNSN